MLGRWAARAAALVFITWVAAAAPAAAHDIPSDVAIQAFVKPDGQTLTLLVRAPLKAFMDVEFPRRERDHVDLERVDPALRNAAMIWLVRSIDVYEEDTRLHEPRILSARMSLESDRSFASYDRALALITGPPLTNETAIFWEQGILNVAFQYAIRSDRSRFSIRIAFDRLGLRVVTALRFLVPDGTVRAYELEGNAGLVPLDPRWHQVALRFAKLGFFHLLDGADHLLFLFCLVIPFRRAWALVSIVTAFTVAHSITLIAAAYNYAPGALWFPPLVETLIAASIVYMALENIAVAAPRWRWIITFVFGLVHGFGFSFGLQHTMQFAGAHLLTSLLSFNLGVEIGQLLVLALAVPALSLLFRYVVPKRTGSIILSAIVAHTAWHWMVDRYGVLRRFPWPNVTAADTAAVIPWLMALFAMLVATFVLSRTVVFTRASSSSLRPSQSLECRPATPSTSRRLAAGTLPGQTHAHDQRRDRDL